MTDSRAHDEVEPVASARNKRSIRVAALGLLALVALIAAVTIFGKDDPKPAAGEQSSSSASTSAPATSAESATSGAATTTPPATTPPSASVPPATSGAVPTDNATGQSEAPAPSGVMVLITSQSWNSASQSIEVVGSVQGIATETSTCTATATMGTHSASSSVPGTFDGQGTSCGLITISTNGLPAGTYQVVISFDAGNGIAKSQPVSVDVA